MNGEVEDRSESTSRGGGWIWLCALGMILVMYVLSVGPVMKITLRRNISNPHPAAQFFTSFYKPLEWAYAHTLLHKPLGLYYHLWVPSVIDSKGDIKRDS